MHVRRGHPDPARLAAVLLACAAVASTAPAAARTWRVPLDAGSVQAGIDSAAVGDTVSLAVGVYLEHDIRLAPGVAVVGEDPTPGKVVVDASGLGRVFVLPENEGTTRLADLTMIHGRAGGAGWPGSSGGALIAQASAPGSVLRLTRVLVVGSEANGPGGGLTVENMDLLMEECTIAGNRSGRTTAWGAGAGVFHRRSLGGEWGVWTDSLLVRAERCLFAGNQARVEADTVAADGGGMLVKGDNNEARVRVEVLDCLFEDNFADQGAGLYVGRFVVGDIRQTIFRRNTAYQHGGGAAKGGRPFYTMGETALFSYCLFEDNRAGFDVDGAAVPVSAGGGAFYTRRMPRGWFHNCTFVGNVAGGSTAQGDAIYQTHELSFFPDDSRCRLVNNVFWGTGGGDVQVRSDDGGFDLVSNNALAPGEFVCAGVVPENGVTLDASPFVASGDPHLDPDGPCVDVGLDLGPAIDLDGWPVPQGDGVDLGAYEVPQSTDIPDPGPAALALSVHPNPFNPLARIELELPRAARLEVAIHDLAGRRVRVLASGRHGAGPVVLVWDGRDESGREAPTGAYLLQVVAGGRAVSRKLMLLK